MADWAPYRRPRREVKGGQKVTEGGGEGQRGGHGGVKTRCENAQGQVWIGEGENGSTPEAQVNQYG